MKKQPIFNELLLKTTLSLQKAKCGFLGAKYEEMSGMFRVFPYVFTIRDGLPISSQAENIQISENKVKFIQRPILHLGVR